MYISILDYSNGTVSIIYDEENVTENMQNEDVYTLLETLRFRESEIYFMISKENPYEPVDEYATIRMRIDSVRITMPQNRRRRNGCASWSGLRAGSLNRRVARVT